MGPAADSEGSDPVKSLVQTLSGHLPAFAIDGAEVEVLDYPEDFYRHLSVEP